MLIKSLGARSECWVGVITVGRREITIGLVECVCVCNELVVRCTLCWCALSVQRVEKGRYTVVLFNIAT